MLRQNLGHLLGTADGIDDVGVYGSLDLGTDFLRNTNKQVDKVFGLNDRHATCILSYKLQINTERERVVVSLVIFLRDRVFQHGLHITNSTAEFVTIK